MLLIFLVVIIFNNIAYAKTHSNTTTNTIYLKDKQVNPKTGEQTYKIDYISTMLVNPLINKTIRYEVTPNSTVIVTNSKITSSYIIKFSDPINPIGYRPVPINEQQRITFSDKLANTRPDLVYEYGIKGADKLLYHVTILTSPPPSKIVKDVINPERIFFETGPKTAIMINDSNQQIKPISK